MNAWLHGLLPLLVGSGARLCAACVGLFATTLAARSLGPAAWGGWVILFAAFGWSQHLAEWGLRSEGLVRGGRMGSVGIGLVRDLALARMPVLVLAICCLVAGTCLWRPDLVMASAWLGATLVAIAMNLDWVALVRGRPWLPGATLILRPTVSVAVLLALPQPLTAATLAFATFSGFAAAAVLGAMSMIGIRASPRHYNRVSSIILLRSGTSFFLVTAANQLAASADLIAVAWMLGASSAGTFGLIITIAQASTMGAQASSQWWLARAARADLAHMRRIIGETALLGALVGVTLAMLGPTLISRLFGPEWREAARLLPLLGSFVALAHVTAVLGALRCVQGRAPAVAAIQIATQLAAWPMQLVAAASFGLTGVILLRSITEIFRLIMLASLEWTKPAAKPGGWSQEKSLTSKMLFKSRRYLPSK